MAGFGVTFTSDEAAIIYCIPREGGRVEEIVSVYLFVNRAGRPASALMNELLHKAKTVGILEEKRGVWKVQAEWYELVHAADGTAENEIESMLAFEEVLVGREWINLEN